MSVKAELHSIFSSWTTAAVLLGLLAVAMAGATFLEAGLGTDAALAVVYHSWWFDLLLALLAVNFIYIGARMKLFAHRRWGVLLLHYGFVVILIGALITHIWGFEGYMHIREGQSADRIMTPGGQARRVPFSVTLDKFTLSRYQGSQSPSSYQSDVTIRYRGETLRRQIYMNNIARVGGYRLYQSSYDGDERGTVLSVNYDPVGTAVSYSGYALLIAGMALALFQRGSRLRKLYASLGKMVVLAVFTFSASGMQAKTPDSMEAAYREFGSLVVQSPDGRIEPMDSYASEILRKLYHKDRFNGMDGNGVLSGILANRLLWEQRPILYAGPKELRDALGLKTRHIRLADLLSKSGYRLRPEVERINALPAAKRSRMDKEYLKLDERASILYTLLREQMLPLFPVAGRERWLSPGDDMKGVPAADSAWIARLFSAFTVAILDEDPAAASAAVRAIAEYQQSAGVSYAPEKIRAEVLYNRADPFRLSMRAYLLLGGALLGISLWNLLRRRNRATTLAARIVTGCILIAFALHTAGLGLRWYISGHAPMTNAYESMVYVGWATVLCGLIFARRSSLALSLGTLLGGVVLFVSNLNWLDPQITPLVPVLKSYWLMIHVSVVTASYGFFGICAACGLVSLAATATGRNLRELRAINEMAMTLGLVLLSTGIFLGAVWANESWGRYWGWDPKETWALITMVVYALITHSRFIPRLNNPFAFDLMSVAGIATVLMTFFGVNYYLSGLHSYGQGGEFSPVVLLAAAGAVGLLAAAAGRRYKKQKRNL